MVGYNFSLLVKCKSLNHYKLENCQFLLIQELDLIVIKIPHPHPHPSFSHEEQSLILGITQQEHIYLVCVNIRAVGPVGVEHLLANQTSSALYPNK